jgi:adenylate cyclase
VDDEREVCKISYSWNGEECSLIIGEGSIVLGRSPECDLVLHDESISRRHAQITSEAGGWTITDLGSKNGLKLNTFHTTGQELCNGDRIDVGAVRLYVEIGPAPATSPAKVVFEAEPGPARRTEVLDMDELDLLLGSSSADLPLRSPEIQQPPDPLLRSEPSLPAEAGGLRHLFSEAADALLICNTLDETLERILALVFNNLSVERGVICLYDEETDTTVPKVMRTSQGIPDEPIVISSNIANDVIKRRQSLLVQDTNLDPRFGGAESVIAMKIHSAMCAPLYRQGRVVGFIYVDQQSEFHPFTAAQLQTLSTLAIFSAIAVETAALRDSVRHEQELRSRLERYSSPAVVDKIIKAAFVPDRCDMAADVSDVTVLFADITNFTSMAESLRPTEVVQVLNQIFERLTEAIFDLDGTLDKFRGDGMMAFFGAPLPLPDHAVRAVEAALRMQEMLSDLNRDSSSDRQITMRIGINSGSVVVGDIGSPARKDYTVIGDPVNIASRLESSVAQPGQVVIGGATYERVHSNFHCRPFEEVRLKGKQQIERPYLVVGRKT